MAHPDSHTHSNRPFFTLVITALAILILLALFAKGCAYCGDEHQDHPAVNHHAAKDNHSPAGVHDSTGSWHAGTSGQMVGDSASTHNSTPVQVDSNAHH